MDKVLVKKAVSAQYPVGAGAPIMVLGGGGRGRDARTLRESAGGLAGGALGALGALTGQHRSLGSLVQSGISGAAQGAAIGRGLGRVFVGPESQARANLEQEIADKYAAARASGEFGRYGISADRRTPMTRVGVRMRSGEMGSSLYDLEQAKQAEKDMLAQQREKEIAAAQARGKDFGTRQMQDAKAMDDFRTVAGLDPNMAASQFMGPIGAAISQQQRQQQGGQPGGVDAAGRPVQVINPSMHPNMLPAPSSSAQDASASSEIVNIENAGNQEAITTGTDMTDSMEVKPTEDEGQSRMSREAMLNAMARAGRQNVTQPQGNREPSAAEKRFNQQSTLF